MAHPVPENYGAHSDPFPPGLGDHVLRPQCPACGASTADGGPCGRDECPGEATRQRATFGAPPPPRQRGRLAASAGLRLARGGVREIRPPPLGAEPYRHPPAGFGPPSQWYVPPRSWWVRAWRWVRDLLEVTSAG